MTLENCMMFINQKSKASVMKENYY